MALGASKENTGRLRQVALLASCLLAFGAACDLSPAFVVADEQQPPHAGHQEPNYRRSVTHPAEKSSNTHLDESSGLVERLEARLAIGPGDKVVGVSGTHKLSHLEGRWRRDLLKQKADKIKLAKYPPRISTSTSTGSDSTTFARSAGGRVPPAEPFEGDYEESGDETRQEPGAGEPNEARGEAEENEEHAARQPPKTTMKVTPAAGGSSRPSVRKLTKPQRGENSSGQAKPATSSAKGPAAPPPAQATDDDTPAAGGEMETAMEEQTPVRPTTAELKQRQREQLKQRQKARERQRQRATQPMGLQQQPTLPPDHQRPRARASKPLVALLGAANSSICTPEAYLEFPPDLIGNKWRARGFVLIHITVVCYMFYSLALVCERYFMPSLEEFSQRLGLSEDVAGATLMSAGSSAPELFTAILGVFIAKGDVGTGTIVGSAVFNILFVIGICAFVSTTTAQLDWWPVLRDSVFYTFTVLVLILILTIILSANKMATKTKFIYDGQVTALESFAMLAFYALYILVMIHNERLKELTTRQFLMNPLTANLVAYTGVLQSVSFIDGPDDVFGGQSVSSAPASGQLNPAQSSQDQQRQHLSPGEQRPNYQTTSMRQSSAGTPRVEKDSIFLAAMLVIVRHRRLFSGKLRFQSAARYSVTKLRNENPERRQTSAPGTTKYTPTVESNEVNYFGPDEPGGDDGSSQGGAAGSQRDRMAAYARTATMSKSKFSIVSRDDYEFWNRPPAEDENYYFWLAKIPVNYVLHYTVPDCAIYPDKYMLTFFLSIAWTAFFSYIMVWMVTLIGYTLYIPDSVMGFTFLAAGTSIPDCYSSIHAARNGMANMAVSNSIGSNIFDILIGLSLPWFIQTAIYPRVVATINSRGVIYSVVLLFLSLLVTIYLMNKYEWTLKPRLGLALLIAYALFIVLTCMLEFNLFGHVNPPPCPVE